MRTSEVRNPFVSPEIIPSDAMASSHSIYATTPPSCKGHATTPHPLKFQESHNSSARARHDRSRSS
ncbi:MAG: hypothetical protein VB140_06900 [Burkholderia sp.]